MKRSNLRIAAASLALCAACGAQGPVLTSKDVVAFTNVRCTPDLGAGATVPQNQTVLCAFRVEGPADRTVTLSCEDEAGSPLPCGPDTVRSLSPARPTTLPITRGDFFLSNILTEARDAQISLYWVADDGVKKVRRRFETRVVAPNPDPYNPPKVSLDCGGDTDGNVSVRGGEALECLVMIGDTSSYRSLRYGSSRIAGPVPVNEPGPSLNNMTGGQLITYWRWQTTAREAGQSWTYQFWAGVGNATHVYRLNVRVE